MAEPNEDGVLDVTHERYTTIVKEFNEKTKKWEEKEKIIHKNVILDKYLTPAPVRFAGLGLHNATPASRKVVLSVACGENHLLVAARDPGDYQSKVYSCGLNSFGQLGNGQAVSKGAFDSNPKLPFCVHELTLVSFVLLHVAPDYIVLFVAFKHRACSFGFPN